jgi:hypothetical protein
MDTFYMDTKTEVKSFVDGDLCFRKLNLHLLPIDINGQKRSEITIK